MWRLLEARLNKRRWIVAALYIGCALSTLAMAAALPQMRQPEHLAAVTGAMALLCGFLVQVAVHNSDAREKRRALHAMLPISRRKLAATSVLEPLVVPIAITTVTVALALGGRLMLGGHIEPVHLLLLISVASFMTLCDQVLLLFMESRERFDSVLIYKVLMPICLAGFGAVTGFLLASWVMENETEQTLVLALGARPELAVSLAALTALACYVNFRLMRTRKSQLC